MHAQSLGLLVGWASILGGAICGAGIGLFFHQESWLGGYGSFRRRMVRLAHIAFFGLGILNVLVALSLASAPLPALPARIATGGFALAALTMPACCFATAWRSSCRHLFPIPVLAVVCGTAALLGGWLLI